MKGLLRKNSSKSRIQKLKVVVIGSGAREHAIAEKLIEDKSITKVYVLPGNDGMVSDRIEIKDIKDNNDILSFCKKNNIKLVVVGPEVPLVNGLVDLLNKNEIKLMKELFIEKMQSQNITNNNNNITKIKNQQNNTNLFISFNDKENIHKIIKGCQETILQLEKVRSKDKCFSIYIDAAHFNPEYPETHNIKLTNLKPDYKLIDIRDENGEWKKKPQKSIFNNLISSSKDFITDIVKDSNPKFDDTININDYDGEDAKEKFILYCNETEYKKKLNNMAKSEIYNKSKEIKNETK